jgi:alpha-tubulin suppressor-like RCC1 family protein
MFMRECVQEHAKLICCSDTLALTSVFAAGVFITSIASSGYGQASEHTCAVSRSGDVWCWGDNTYCQLGVGDNFRTSGPSKASLPAGGFIEQDRVYFKKNVDIP